MHLLFHTEFGCLHVIVPANITSLPQSTSASLGGTARFLCGASGFYQPLVSWGRLIELQENLFNDEKFVITILESNSTTGTLLSM